MIGRDLLQSPKKNGIQEGVGVDEDDDVDDEDSKERECEMCEGTLHLKKPPTIFVWETELVDERSLKTELDRGSPKDVQEVVEELQAAFGDLEGLVVDSRRDLRKDALDVLTHVGFSVTEIVPSTASTNVADAGSAILGASMNFAMRQADKTSPSSRR